jgi:hypothetical protein
LGHQVTFNYSVREGTFSPKSISVNGKAINFTYDENKYRKGGAVIPSDQFLDWLQQKNNIVEIRL